METSNFDESGAMGGNSGLDGYIESAGEPRVYSLWNGSGSQGITKLSVMISTACDLFAKWVEWQFERARFLPMDSVSVLRIDKFKPIIPFGHGANRPQRTVFGWPMAH